MKASLQVQQLKERRSRAGGLIFQLLLLVSSLHQSEEHWKHRTITRETLETLKTQNINCGNTGNIEH